MAKYRYTYFVNNEKVTRDQFLQSLRENVVTTHVYCGWCGVDSTDEPKVQSYFRKMRREGERYSICICGDDTSMSYKIKKEEIVHA